MGYVLLTAACWICGRMFASNPMRVPSIPIAGERQPICLDCVERVNPMRVAKGLEPIVPLPGAYEACDENELEED